MRSLIGFGLALVLPGCMIFFDGDGKRPPQCDQVATGAAESLPAPLRNPDQLTCDSFGGGGCDPACGPCPAGDTRGADLAPIPTWGVCGSFCDSLSEDTCAANADCRVVRDARCAIDGNCTTDFVGCFPIDNQPDPSLDCFAARDGWTCSRSSACTALHQRSNCQPGEDCPRPFGLCIAEGRDPGRCFDQAACDRASPNCPAGTMPGVANGCYTDACIPLSLCETSL